MHRTTKTVALLASVLTACSADSSASDSASYDGGTSAHPNPDVAASKPEAEVRVAFVGDQGVNAQARKVLQLVLSERADAVMLLGDLAYDEASAARWEAQLNEELGDDFPVLSVIGNHDAGEWYGESGFAEILSQRLSRMPDTRCDGEYGVKATCTFRGLSFVLSGVGTHGSGHEEYIDSALQSSDATFRLCIWHKNQHDMQVGAKGDEVGWAAYQVCARHGVPIITGHEHSYSRSQTLSAIGERERMHGATGNYSSLQLAPGRTFVVVSGLGGQSRRAQTPEHAADEWWAAAYARDYQLRDAALAGTQSEIQDGALFVVFHVDGGRSARAYFKTVDGLIHDTFSWTPSSPAED
jgi:3',5'-cyclic AMP phosphodiesterase CpdA